MKIQVVKKVLNANNTIAEQNRKLFAEKKVFVINIMSSPGSGKTKVLEKTLELIKHKIKSAVIVGDVCTTNDADRLSKTGVKVIQVNTDEFGGDCHLAAHVIQKAASDMDLDAIDFLIIENVGNLVCPAEFDIGENARAVVLSTTEGEDKPLKYPLMFRVCDVALLNKIDLLPYLEFDKNTAIKNIQQIKPDMPIFEVSAMSGLGLEKWIKWIEDQIS